MLTTVYLDLKDEDMCIDDTDELWTLRGKSHT